MERIVRDLRLAFIWTGTNDVMSMIIANEWYRCHGKRTDVDMARAWEQNAAEADAADEKIDA